MPTALCPSLDELSRFERGDVSDDELDRIAQHLAECDLCSKASQRREPFWEQVVAQSISSEVEPALQHCITAIADRPMAANIMPEVGHQIGEYELIDKVGAGGMGSVFRAKHLRLEKNVALKVISSSRFQDPASAVRFEREMKAIGRLKHPNIVAATDAGTVNHHPYLVMEFVEGQTLSQWVKQHGPMPSRQAISLAAQVCQGLEHAHSAGIIHRDIKPSNLMLTKSGTIKILDLGLALPTDSQSLDETMLELSSTQDENAKPADITSASRVVGTLAYMAPEQLQHAHMVDHRADLFGLGRTLWFLLSGTLPERGIPLSQLKMPAEVPVAMWKKLLAHDPNDRYSSAEEVRKHLLLLLKPKLTLTATWPIALAMVASVIGILIFRGFFPIPEVLGKANSSANATATHAALTATPASAPIKPKLKHGAAPMSPMEATNLRREWAGAIDQPIQFRNPLGIEFTFIPPGEFEFIPNTVFELSRPFYLSCHEITYQQFNQFVVETGLVTIAEKSQYSYLAKLQIKELDSQYGPVKWFVHENGAIKVSQVSWRNPGYPGPYENLPVTHICHAEAVKFCEWLSQKEGKRYRLPTRAEWLWATQAGGVEKYAHTSDFTDHKRHPKDRNPIVEAGFAKPHRPTDISLDSPNNWGVCGACDNVAEWNLDYPMKLSPGRFVDPKSDKPLVEGNMRITVSGCAFGDGIKYVPESRYYHPNQTSNRIGFRILCEISDSTTPKE